MKFNLKVFLLLIVLLQVVFTQDGFGGDGGHDGHDHNNNNNRNKCIIEIGPYGQEAILFRGNNQISGNFGLTEVDFFGDCNCELILYNRRNWRGQMFDYPFSDNDGNSIYPDDIWFRRVRSFKIICRFY